MDTTNQPSSHERRPPTLSESVLRAVSLPIDPWIALASKVPTMGHLLEGDPFVDFQDTYAPTRLQKALWRNRYRAAARGWPLHPNEWKIRRFHNRHRGQRCFVIGNGPSLRKNDLSLLKNEITFGVNAIYLNEETRDFVPTHYVVEDVFVAEDRADDINAWHRPYKWFGNYLRHCLKADANTMWMNVSVDYRQRPGFPRFSKDASRILYVGGTVSFLSLQLAYYMGFDEVYLIGFDHSYVVKSDVTKDGNKLVSNSDDPNHFHKDYFGKGFRWHEPRVDRMELAYHNANKAFEEDGRRVLNATVGGHLEVFPRVSYESLFSPRG